MEIVHKLLIFVIVGVVNANSSSLRSLKQSEFSVSQPAAQIITGFYMSKGTSFHVVRAVASFNKQLCNDIVSEVLQNVSDVIATAIENFNEMEKANGRKKFSVIIFTDSVKSIIKFQTKFSSQNFKFRRFFTIVLIRPLTNSDLKSIFELFWNIFVKNVNIIMMNEIGTADLFTFIPFSENKCGDTTPLIINTFDKDLVRWKRDEFHPVKTSNLHNCPILITGGVSASEPALMTRYDSKGNIEVYGSEKDIFLELSRILNFEPKFEIFGSFPGLVFENGTSSGKLSFHLHI